MIRHRRLSRLVLAIAILSSFVGCDQATKRYATSSLQNSQPKSMFGDTVRLEYALNPGGFLSVGSQLTPETRFFIFVGFNLLIMTGLCFFLYHQRNARLAIFISLSYILAGGIGNLIDRVTNDGLVIDFLNLGIGRVRTGIFNIADIGVMFGAVALVFLTYRHETTEPGSKPKVTG